MIVPTGLPLTEPGALGTFVSIASPAVIAGTPVFLAACWIVLGER